MEDNSEQSSYSEDLDVNASSSFPPATSATSAPPPRRSSSKRSLGGIHESHHSTDGISETDSGWSDVYREGDDDSLEDFDNQSHHSGHNHVNTSLNLERIKEDDVVLHVKLKNTDANPDDGRGSNPAIVAFDNAPKDDAYDSEDDFWDSSGDWDGNDTAAEEDNSHNEVPQQPQDLQLEHENNTLVLEHAQNTAQEAKLEMDNKDNDNQDSDKDDSDNTNDGEPFTPAPPKNRRPSFPANPRRQSFLGQFLEKEHKELDADKENHKDDTDTDKTQGKNGTPILLNSLGEDEESDVNNEDISGIAAVIAPATPTKDSPEQQSPSNIPTPDIKPLTEQQRHDLSVPLGLDPDLIAEQEENWDDMEDDDAGWDEADDDDDAEDDGELEDEGEAAEEEKRSEPEDDNDFQHQFVVAPISTTPMATNNDNHTREPASVEKVDGDEYHSHYDETATAITEEMTQSTPRQTAGQQSEDNEEDNEQEQDTPPATRTLVAPSPPPTEQRPSNYRLQNKKPRTPKEWERLVATWQRMEVSRNNSAKSPQNQQPLPESNKDKPTESTNEDETSLPSMAPNGQEDNAAPAESTNEDETSLPSMAPNGQEDNAASGGPTKKPANAMKCAGEGVFPFCFLTKKKGRESSYTGTTVQQSLVDGEALDSK